MDSANNSSSLQSSSGGGEVEEFDSRAFFATATGINTSAANANSSRGRRRGGGGSSSSSHLHFFDSLPFLDPSPSFPLLPNPPAKTPAPAPAPKNSRKRSRASRRAPTTVLTTDTSNFRAMVQEFTGIPAPPFSSTSSALSSSSYPRPRFDFFSPAINASSSSSASASSFLLKPYPHKLQVPSNINASSSSSIINIINNNNNNSVIANPTGFNYQSPILNFQSLLQSQLAASRTADLGVKAQQQQQQPPPMMMPSTSASAEYGVADLGLPGLIGSGWGQDAGNNPTQLRQDVSNRCKLNFSAAAAAGVAAEFGGAEKGGEPRGEGMVESWICSSD